MPRAWVCASLVSGICFAMGCGGTSGDKQFENLVPVEGTVTLDGAPVDQGTVSFVPDDPQGQPATGQIHAGKFTMLTTVSAHGVIAGNYKVRIDRVALASPDPFSKSANTQPKDTPSFGGIPRKYGDINTSGLEVSVVPEMVPVEFDLNSK